MAYLAEQTTKQTAEIIPFPNKKIQTEIDELAEKAFEIMDQEKWKYTDWDPDLRERDSWSDILKKR
ncbi:hypothetical protein [Cytobacillus sp. IB215665]|uniref:hypothetical protein n=1 Tax=Cytobacillus sp. IB215665 TaxID=3097357 RepID=UPI002A10FEF1|nr:hypothetical protein [Cytobacillus sp. IB215665]MDX8367822.1 hypothetical protein [Cytobacillus sp. IB215665]